MTTDLQASAAPHAHAATPPACADTAVHWFGQSRRTIGGVPDSRYGWLPWAGGPCIVKAMDPKLVAYNATLLDHEHRMLARLQALGAPAPALVETGRSDWLVTRFAGLSLQRLEHPGGLQGLQPGQRWTLHERMAVWVHLLRRLQPMADAGVLAIDLYDANVVLPLTEGTQGQLRLHEVVLIDHAYTLEPGLAMRRPVWLNREMARIAPELRAALQHDQEALMQAFARAGAALPGYSRLPGDRDQHSRRVWAEYDAPQALQQLLDSGRISRDAAMQFAVGTAAQALLAALPFSPLHEPLQDVLLRMTAAEPARRYLTLTESAEALAAVLGAVPMVSAHAYAPLQPADLALPARPAAPASGQRLEDPATRRADEIQTLLPRPAHATESVEAKAEAEATKPSTACVGAPSCDPPWVPTGTPTARARPAASAVSAWWLYGAAGLAAMAGACVPLPW